MQMVRSMLSWAATDIVCRTQHMSPLYGNCKNYPILAVRGFTGAAAMTLYYEGFERLDLSEGVSFCLHLTSHWCMHQDII